MTRPQGTKRNFARATSGVAHAQYALNQFGSLGAAGPCKRIDPKTGEVIEVLEPRTFEMGDVALKPGADRWHGKCKAERAEPPAEPVKRKPGRPKGSGKKPGRPKGTASVTDYPVLEGGTGRRPRKPKGTGQ